MSAIAYSYFSGTKDNVPKRREFEDWPAMVRTFQASPETDTKEGPAWSPCVYRPGEKRGRKAGQGEALSCLVLDFDMGVAPGPLRKLWEPYTYLIHSTHSSSPDFPKWRAIFPLAASVPVSEWGVTWAKLVFHLGGGFIDESCKDSSRYYYFPAHRPGVEPFFLVHAGRRLDPGALPDPPPKVEARSQTFSPPAEKWSPADLIEEALGKIGTLGGRDNAGFYLAGQARDEGYTRGEVESMLLAYQRMCPPTNSKGEFDPYREADALHNVESAFAHPPRAPRARRLPEAGTKGGVAAATKTRKPPAGGPLGENGANGASAPPNPPESAPDAPDEAATKAADLPTDEKGMAARFVLQMRTRYMTTEGGLWWRYDRGAWGAIDRQAILSVMDQFLQPYQTDKNYARLVENVTKIAGLRLYVPLNRLNAHPDWIPLANGILDTTEHRFLDHAPSYLLTTQLPYDYDPEATCPRWMQFLHEVLVDTKGEPSLEMAALLQEWFGYCLVPDTRAQTSMWWLGGGANGKGIATKILESLIGEKQRVGLDIENLHEGYHRASLYGKLLAIVSEIAPRAMVRSGSWFKAIVAGDTISARQIGKDVFSFAPTARVLVTANELPKTYDRTFGYFRRLKLLFFRVDLAEEKQDRDLLDKLLVELPGIFNWALIGLYRLQAQRMKFSKSEDAEQELASYRYEQDPVARFVDDWCQRDAEGEEQTSELWEAFGRWCKTNGEVPGNSVSFHRALSRLGFEAALRWDAAKGTNNRVRVGIKLLVRREFGTFNYGEE